MNTTVFHRRRVERFAQLLDESRGLPRHHVQTQADDDLRELVTVGDRVRAMPINAAPDPQFRMELRALLIATAERDGIGATAAPVETAPAPRRLLSRGRTRAAILAGVATGAIAISGMSAASGDAMPGDALYGVKRSTERAQLALASSDITRGQLHLDFARNRVAEAATVPAGDERYAAMLADMDAHTRQGVRLLTTSAVSRNDGAALAAVDAFTGIQRREVTGLLDRATGADRDRTLSSLALLDDVAQRSDALAATLDCVSGVVASDELGPQPRSCGSADAPRGAGGERSGATAPGGAPGIKEAGKERARPSVGPTGAATQPSAGASPSAGTDASGSPTPGPETPADEDGEAGGGLLDGVGRILGDLLGG